MLLTRLVAGQNLHDLWERQWRPKNGPPGLSPTELWDLTAGQLFAMFFKFLPPPGAAPPEIDNVAMVAAVNRRAAARGELPAIPFHILKGVPRG